MLSNFHLFNEKIAEILLGYSAQNHAYRRQFACEHKDCTSYDFMDSLKVTFPCKLINRSLYDS